MRDILAGLSHYELGRARGAAYGRKEPDQSDAAWIADLLDGVESDDDWEEFERGMLDGAEQVATINVGGFTAPPSADVIAAARDAK